MSTNKYTTNSTILYLAVLALGLMLVPFLIQAIRTNAVAEYKSSYASDYLR